jgi:iron complex outermembrane receptor protein
VGWELQSAQNFSNKLLMLIDGRSVYSPLFSGIYLDTQDVMLSDVSRIEVISGPGSSLWGANAMHGVINVITRPAHLTQGLSLSAGAGLEEQHVGIRHGAHFGGNGAWRIYGRAQRRDATELSSGVSAEDSWRRAQVGARMDAGRFGGNLTLQGDAYKARMDRLGEDVGRMTGANLLGRWQRDSARGSLQLQAYFDHVQRDTREQEGVRVNTFDIEVQQDLRLARHHLVLGAGTRLHRYHVRGSQGLQFTPDRAQLMLWNLFAQDTIALGEQVRLTLGIKLERNDFSGWEPQPEARLAWQPRATTLAWASAARAIRAPTPVDTQVDEYVNGTHLLEGDPDFEPESLLAYDVGMRQRIGNSLWLNASLFYNDYTDLRTIEWGEAPVFLPLRFENRMHGHTYGLNAWATWQVTDWWRLAPGFELLRKKLRFDDDAFGPLGVHQSGNDPRGHARLVSSMDLGPRQLLEVTLRHVGRMPEPAMKSHTELSLRYARRFSDSLELSLRGVNLLRGAHREYPAGDGRLIKRGAMLEARWSH